MKVLAAPFVLLLAVVVGVLKLIVGLSSLVLGLFAALLLLMAFPVLFSMSVAGGLVLIVLAFLISPIGIALVVQVGGNLCRDAGESALASVVETAGTLCALLAALPLLRAVLDMLLELME